MHFAGKGNNLYYISVVVFMSYSMLCAEETDPRRHLHPERGVQDREARQIESYNWFEGDYLTGDWNGARTKLAEKGVLLEFVYTGEVMSNTRGGRNTNGATEYIGAVDVTAEIVPEKMGGWKNGTFFLWFENVHGKGISADHVGDFQTVSNLEAEPFSTLYEYWYKHEFYDGRFWIKVGKQDANETFASSDYGGEFIQSSFGFPPNIPFGTFPDPGLAFAAGFEINEWAYIQAMFQDGAPNGKSVGGFKAMFDGDDGHIALFEFHLRPKFMEGKLPGTYRFGSWIHNGDWDELGEMPPGRVRTYRHNYGLYAIFDQAIYREKDDEDDEQGLGLFFQFAWSPDNRSEATVYTGGGAVYTGLFPTRDNDKVGVGIAHVRFSDRLHAAERLTQETAIDFFYRVQTTPFISLQPQLQYIVNPGGDGRDALAVGLRFEVNF